MSPVHPPGLVRLARLYNVQTSYYDVFGKRREASTESLVRVLQAQGAPLARIVDCEEALRARRQSLWQIPVSPVIVAWEGSSMAFDIRCPLEWENKTLAVQVELETGQVQKSNLRLSHTETAGGASVEGSSYLVKRVSFASKLPWGYHHLSIQIAGHEFHALVLSGPNKAYAPAGAEDSRLWGVFLPLYSLRTGRSWAGGDFTDLQNLTAWVKNLGGGVVGTLPLLAAFLEKPFEISPYSPASRLFWNEFYLDVTRVPELERCPEARSILESSAFQNEIRSLRQSPTVDYRKQIRMKRRVLEKLAQVFFAGESRRRTALRRFLKTHGGVEDYARFRAVCEAQGASWPVWPERLRDGRVRPGDYSESAKRYHLYAQWLTHEQLSGLAQRTNGVGTGLYLDLPLGVHSEGYDVWRERDLFATDVSGGAPPDSVFCGGQNWGFAPLRPDKAREQGYRYVVAVLSHHLEHASYLRIDHVMGLHRLFWIPKGMPADQGVYVGYPENELYAILCLESHRHRALVAGENLGTVPKAVNSMMARHGVQRMYVAQYELTPEPERALPAVPRDSMASLNTHDMRPFAAFWQGADIEDIVRLGLINESKASRERKKRSRMKRALVHFLKARGWIEKKPGENIAEIMKACLAYLSSSRARVVLINLEDLWLEEEAQNLPGTGGETLNWRKKARWSMEEFRQVSEILEIFQRVSRLRQHGGVGRRN